ncbi:MAG: septum formation protein Maf [Flavobacteriaceae bacterium]|nr:septum formation protein Maf [Flavobacteriaceae bacterium]
MQKIILASASPRRQELLQQMKVPFVVKTKEVDEVYSDNLKGREVTEFLANLKADAFSEELQSDELLITADTIVWHKDKVLGKPKTAEDAMKMLRRLSGNTHQVITSVCLKTTTKKVVFSEVTEVTFKHLSDAEISFYIEQYQPFDKAGSYGIQEWIGHIGITKIEGSYFNVMGLPTQQLYEHLKAFNRHLWKK